VPVRPSADRRDDVLDLAALTEQRLIREPLVLVPMARAHGLPSVVSTPAASAAAIGPAAVGGVFTMSATLTFGVLDWRTNRPRTTSRPTAMPASCSASRWTMPMITSV